MVKMINRTSKVLKLDKAFDCYNIDLYGHKYEDIRSLCKMGIMCMINCKSAIGSAKALHKIVLDDSEDKEPYLKPFHKKDFDFFQLVVNLLKIKHKRLNFFSKDEVLWKKLQRLDSRVMEGVLEYFTKKDEVVLGWHDSWVIRKPLRNELKKVVEDSWFRVFGTYDNCFIKVEF